jgi:putative polyketide hydroxylase
MFLKNFVQERTSESMSTPQYDENVPVLIVGGSLVGLSTALFLSCYDIPCLLVERHAGISPFPRAGGFNQRTLEFFHAFGVESAIRAAAPSNMQNRSIVRMETLAGPEFNVYVPNLSEAYSDVSPIRGSVITQDLMEPVLRTYAEQHGGDLRFNTQLVSFEQDADGVSAIIKDLASGQESSVRARYLVAADGNRSAIRQQLGIDTHGPGTLQHIINMRFRADLRGPLRGRRILVGFLMKNQGIFGGDDDGGLMAVPYHPEKGEREEDFAGERGIAVIREGIGVPDLPVEITEVLSWEMAARVAERFQQGRVFLVGDSAHVMPPTGGLGANTGIGDAHNLAWKLALVLKEEATSKLLATYDVERRPVAQLTVGQAYANAVERLFPHLASTVTTPILDYNIVVFGYRYSSSAVLTNSDEAPKLYDDPYHPTGQPGMRAPHIVLARSGEHLSTIDLFNQHFVLLCGSAGEAWNEAACRVAERFGITLHAYCIGKEGDLVAVNDDFLSTYEILADGAVLVRPDGFIGWRAETSSEQPAQALEQTLTHILGR